MCIGIGLLLAVGALYLQKTPPYKEYSEYHYEKQTLKEALHNLSTMKKAVELYFSNTNDYSKADIFLQEILKLAEMDLTQGQWDTVMGVYASDNFIYIGGCYSTWCYIEANRKNISYNLFLKYDGKKWINKNCSTQFTEVGRSICQQLQKQGWKYIDGES